MTLRLRLALAFVAVALVPLVVAGVLVSVVVPRVQAAQAQTETLTARNALALWLDQACQRARAAAGVLAGTVVTVPAVQSPAAVRDVTERGLADIAEVAGSNGQLLARAGPALPVQAPLGDCAGGRLGSPYAVAAETMLEERTGGPVVGAARAAVLLGPDQLSTLRPALVGESGGLALVRNGQVVAANGVSEDLATRAAAVVTGPDSSDRAMVNRHQVAATPPVPGLPRLIAFSRALPDPSRLRLLTLAAVLGLLALAGLLGALIARVTTRPLAELSEAAARVRQGDLQATIPVRTSDEVGRLGASFNAMTTDLRAHVEQLQDSRDELRRNVARLGEALGGTHDLGRIFRVILDTAVDSVHASAGLLLLVAGNRDELYLRHARGCAHRGVEDGLQVRVGRGVLGQVAESGEPVFGPLRGEGAFDAGPGEPQAEHVLAVPLRSGGRLIGVLGLYDRADGRPFDRNDLETVRTFAGQAATAVANVFLHQEAQRLSITDGLTGLWNYRYFTLNIGKEIERAARFDRPLALLMLDLDRFKAVNDSHGHQRGDSVLCELAARVRGEIREVDMLARYGGEELVLVLPETDQDGAVQAAERVGDVVRRRPFGHEGEVPLPVTVSIGVAIFPTHGRTTTTLLRAADEALYAAKAAGRDTWRIASDIGSRDDPGPPPAQRLDLDAAPPEVLVDVTAAWAAGVRPAPPAGAAGGGPTSG